MWVWVCGCGCRCVYECENGVSVGVSVGVSMSVGVGVGYMTEGTYLCGGDMCCWRVCVFVDMRVGQCGVRCL